jgi:hypothetical protein
MDPNPFPFPNYGARSKPNPLSGAGVKGKQQKHTALLPVPSSSPCQSWHPFWGGKEGRATFPVLRLVSHSLWSKSCLILPVRPE